MIELRVRWGGFPEGQEYHRELMRIDAIAALNLDEKKIYFMSGSTSMIVHPDDWNRLVEQVKRLFRFHV